jgi:hypothetical protein
MRWLCTIVGPRRIDRVVVAYLVVALIVSLVAREGAAITYAFTRIADTTTEFSVETFLDANGMGKPSVSAGAVAFQACYGEGAGCGIFVGSGGPLTTIVQDGTPAPTGMFNSVPPLSFANPPAIGAATTAFRGEYEFNPSFGEYTQQGIFTGSGGTLSTIIKKGDSAPTSTFTSFMDPAISGGSVAFQGTYGISSQGIFLSTGGAPAATATTNEAAPGLTTFTSFKSPDIHDSTVAFTGSYTDGQGVFSRASGGPIAIVAKSGDPAPVGTPVVNFDSGGFGEPVIASTSLAFRASYGGGDGTGIFRSTGGQLTKIVKTGDPAPVGTINGLTTDPSISGDLVAFVGNYGAQHALFVGDSGAIVPVIKRGDILFGSSVATLGLSRFGFDADGSGKLAFNYTLVDGRVGVALASPGGLPLGDYNRDNVIDSADYALWRNTLGATVEVGAGADGNYNGIIDGNDYFLWRARFGQRGNTNLASGSAVVENTSIVPEPTSCGLLLTALAWGELLRLRIRKLRINRLVAIE